MYALMFLYENFLRTVATIFFVQASYLDVPRTAFAGNFATEKGTPVAYLTNTWTPEADKSLSCAVLYCKSLSVGETTLVQELMLWYGHTIKGPPPIVVNPFEPLASPILDNIIPNSISRQLLLQPYFTFVNEEHASSRRWHELDIQRLHKSFYLGFEQRISTMFCSSDFGVCRGTAYPIQPFGIRFIFCGHGFWLHHCDANAIHAKIFLTVVWDLSYIQILRFM